MGKTVTEKILARAAGLPAVSAGQEIRVKPDYVLAYDWPGQTDVIFREIQERFGLQALVEPERFGVFIDHMTSGPSAKEQAFHAETLANCARYGIAVYENRGIGHHVASEVGYAAPGAFVVHFDGHVSQLGAFGTLAIGLRRSLIEAFVQPAIEFTVPATVRVDFHGRLQPGVMARDVFHHLIDTLGPDSCSFQVLELGGAGVSTLTTSDLQELGGLAMFVGACTAIVNPEDDTRYTQARKSARRDFGRPVSDHDAHYTARHSINLSAIEPMAAAPHTSANIIKLSDCTGVAIHKGYIGSCVSGRLEDLRAAAQLLKGRRIHPDFTLHVVPTSQAILQAATHEGLIATLSDAGARIGMPTCDYCYGRNKLLDAGERAVSTGTLNVRGRMGEINAEIYLCSPATIAASALNGCITDPRQYFDRHPS